MSTNGNSDIGSLSTRAMLCGLHISMWGNRRLDKQMSREAASSRGMGEKVGRYNKWLLIQDEAGTPVKEYDAIVTIRNRANVIHRSITLPWVDDGTRINTARNFPDWATAMREQKNQFQTAVDYFVQEYPRLFTKTKQIMDDAAQKEIDRRIKDGKPIDGVKSMFNPNNYPSQAELATRFAFATSVWPLPESADFRARLSDSQVSAIKDQIQANLNNVVMKCTGHLFNKLGDLVERVLYLADPQSTVQKALARDIEELTGIAERLNVEGNTYLDAFARRIRKELAFEPVMLKTVTGAREDLVERAARIQEDMAGFMNMGGEDE